MSEREPFLNWGANLSIDTWQLLEVAHHNGGYYCLESQVFVKKKPSD